VILCAILDPKNWEIPFLNSTDKSSWPRAFGLYLQKEYPHKSSRLGWDSHETEEEEERKERIKVEEVKVVKPWGINNYYFQYLQMN
jgi:hypothetical protein